MPAVIIERALRMQAEQRQMSRNLGKTERVRWRMSPDVYAEVVLFGSAGLTPAYREGPAERLFSWPIVVDKSLRPDSLWLEPLEEPPGPDVLLRETIG